jgi:hypothetical protein
MSLCLDCILFTVKGANVKENKYIDIFIMWLSLFIKNSGFGASDLLHIKIDSETFETIKSKLAFSTLINSNKAFPIRFLVFQQPENVLDGMMMRFMKFNYTQDIYMYCDIDILILKPLSLLCKNLPINTICVHSEGLLTDTNYGSAFSKEEISRLPPNSLGFSSGKFMIYGKELYSEFLDTICHLKSKNSDTYYTLDQPFYNKALYLLNKEKYNTSLLDATQISPNGHFYTKDCVLLDAMGVPGDGNFHFDKILNFYILIQMNLF